MTTSVNMNIANKKKGRNWSHEEDKQLCLSWLHVSEDSVFGADQTAETMWQKNMQGLSFDSS